MVYEKIRTIISEHLGIDEDKMNPHSTLGEDLEADSLDAVEIIMALEDEFSIEIPDEAAERFVCLKDMVDYVEANI